VFPITERYKAKTMTKESDKVDEIKSESTDQKLTSKNDNKQIKESVSLTENLESSSEQISSSQENKADEHPKSSYTTVKDVKSSKISNESEEIIETNLRSEDIDKETDKQNFLFEEEKVYSNKQIEDLSKIYIETIPVIEDKQVLNGTVVRITDKVVVVDINFKSDGVINSSEFKYNKELKIGDSVEVLVEQQEDSFGQLKLSHRRARVLQAWKKVNLALETGEIVNGQIKSRTKGGMIVDVFGIECFLPGSQIDVKPIRDYEEYVGKEMQFKVVKVNESFRNVVVSHKALIEADLIVQTKEIMSKLEKGQVLEGTVKNITSYGVFVDLGGIDGLIHITDLSWGRISHPEEIVNLDESIKVVILDFDEDKSRIQLGLKQLGSHPWESLDSNLKVGDEIDGKVVVLADYGVFVEVQTGVEALLHVSEMSWSSHLRSAGDFFKVGDSVKAKILTLDRDERKMSLGIKQMLPDPWSEIDKNYPVGTKLEVKVRNFTNFGIFVEIEEGVDGLIHISDLSWTKKIKHPSEFTSVDSKINVIVLDVDKDSRKISLGHKQILENPWDVYAETFKVNSIHRGIVKEMYDKGAIIEINDIEAFCPKKHLIKEDESKAKVGDDIQFKVIDFSKESKKILVSHTNVYMKIQNEEKQKSKKQTSSNLKKIQDSQKQTTLGDLDELNKLKDEIE
tara:strand:+ start:51 stop:2093 length:2043 start_codon:yes stop_codon:yes gene_type:complete